MENGFERNLKESLEQLEFPYDPAAWNALQQKLDVVKPVQHHTGNTAKRWLFGGIAAAGIVVAGFALLRPAADKHPNISVPNAVQSVQATPGKPQSAPQKATTVSSITKQTQQVGKPVAHNFVPVHQRRHTSTNNTVSATDETTEAYRSQQEDPTNDSRTNYEGFFGQGNGTANCTGIPDHTYKFPESVTACSGDLLEIKNQNAIEMQILNNQHQVVLRIPANSTKTLKVTAEVYYYASVKNQKNYTLIAKVNSLPGIEFSADPLYYEQGLPVVDVHANTEISTVNWKTDSREIREHGKEASIYMFDKGMHTITATVTDSKGCSNEVSKTISIDDNYNLMAMTGFRPTSSDSRNNTFIPYALVLRNTPFKLEIMDSKDGFIVYETTNAENGWDGIDRRTGQLVDEGKLFIWKVTLFAPEAGEKAEYKGTVVRM